MISKKFPMTHPHPRKPIPPISPRHTIGWYIDRARTSRHRRGNSTNPQGSVHHDLSTKAGSSPTLPNWSIKQVVHSWKGVICGAQKLPKIVSDTHIPTNKLGNHCYNGYRLPPLRPYGPQLSWPSPYGNNGKFGSGSTHVSLQKKPAKAYHVFPRVFGLQNGF